MVDLFGRIIDMYVCMYVLICGMRRLCVLSLVDVVLEYYYMGIL